MVRRRNIALPRSVHSAKRLYSGENGVTLIELLAGILLFSLILGGIGAVMTMGQKSAHQTAVYTSSEQQLSQFLSQVVDDGLNSFAVTQDRDVYTFVGNKKETVLKYLRSNQALVLEQSSIEMLKISHVTDFEFMNTSIPYAIRIEVTDEDGVVHTLENRWTPRKTKK